MCFHVNYQVLDWTICILRSLPGLFLSNTSSLFAFIGIGQHILFWNDLKCELSSRHLTLWRIDMLHASFMVWMLNGVKRKNKVTYAMQFVNTTSIRRWCILISWGYGTFLRLTTTHSVLSWSTAVVLCISLITTLYIAIYIYILNGKPDQYILWEWFFKLILRSACIYL